jgi:serine/threonine protein kinase
MKFLQEMEALSRVDHPGIVGVLDTGELPNGTPFLVVQHVVGVTLRQELDKGPLHPRRAASILRQIGGALEAAHSLEIAHRDLKPENIMLQQLSDGTEFVKLIDFGIAAIGKSSLSSDTTTTIVAGTARYMAPEQCRGQASKASDIYALGLIVCEMLSGQPDLHGLKAPRRIRQLILAALAYRPQDRPQRASEFSNDLAEVLIESLGSNSGAPNRPFLRPRIHWIAAAVLLLITAVAPLSIAPLFDGGRASDNSAKLSLLPPEGMAFGDFQLSPDGRRIVIVAMDGFGKTQLWVRPLASLTYQPLAGTEGARSPFWSPDSRFIGFFSDARLRKIDTAGGYPETICNVEVGSSGGTWNRNGAIIFALNPGTSLYRVSAGGGQPVAVTALDSEHGETNHSWPQFLPDGRHFLYLSHSAHPEDSAIYVASLDSPNRRRVLSADSSALYASGYLLWQRDRTLMAQPFDRIRLELTGEAVSVAENVAIADATQRPFFSVSETGVLAHDASSPGDATQLLWLDRAGRRLGSVVSRSSGPVAYSNINLSPDGSRLAVDRRDAQAPNRDIWLFDLKHGEESRLTFDAATDASPVWSPDARELVFFSAREGVWNLYRKAVTGAGDDEPLLKSHQNKISCDWSRNGYILFRQWDPTTKWDLWVLALQGEHKPQLIVQTPFEETCGQFSPDGRWVAYVSNESGRNEVYVEAFTPGSAHTGKWQISTTGGSVPRWRRDGKELFYLGADQKLMAVAVISNSTFHAGAPQALFQTHSSGFLRYDVTADGQRFLVNTALAEPSSSLPTVVLNWTTASSR